MVAEEREEGTKSGNELRGRRRVMVRILVVAEGSLCLQLLAGVIERRLNWPETGFVPHTSNGADVMDDMPKSWCCCRRAMHRLA
jgi:hypothetical protein